MSFITSLFGGGKPKLPQQPVPPSTASQQIQQAQADARRRAMAARGRASTILSGGAGLGTVGGNSSGNP